MMQCPGCGGAHIHPQADADIAQLFDVASAAWLQQAGVHTMADLSAVGAAEAYLRVEALDVKPGMNLLYALDGAIHAEHWLQVKRQRGAELLAALAAAKEQIAV